MRLALVGLILMMIMIGCRQQVQDATEAGIRIDLSFEPEIPVVGEAVLRITVVDAAGSPINDAQIDIRGDMSHAGMQPVLRQVEQGDGGVYEIPFEWTMAGDWFIEVSVTLPDGTIVTEIFDYEGVQESS